MEKLLAGPVKRLRRFRKHSITPLGSIAVSSVLTLFFAEGCAANEPPKLVESVELAAENYEAGGKFFIDSRAGSVAGVTVGMTESQLRESGWPYDTTTKNLEGDEYEVYNITLADGIVLSCTLDLDNTLYSIESSSAEIRDEYGLGVGSTLSKLKEFYARVRFSMGSEEGRYASFLTGTRLIFRFDPDDLDDECFEYGRRCAIDESIIKAETVVVGKFLPE